MTELTPDLVTPQNLPETVKKPDILTSIKEGIGKKDLDKSPLLTNTGKISVAGRVVAEELYDKLFDASGRDYVKFLEQCHDAQKELDESNSENKAGYLKVIQSLRGKAVYRAQAAWVSQNVVPIDKEGLSASHISSLSKTLREQNQVTNLEVYEQARNIEWKNIDSELQRKTASLEAENKQIIEQDLPNDTAEPERLTIRQKLTEFAGRLLTPRVRQKLVAVALVGMMAFGLSGSSSKVSAANENNVGVTPQQTIKIESPTPIALVTREPEVTITQKTDSSSTPIIEKYEEVKEIIPPIKTPVPVSTSVVNNEKVVTAKITPGIQLNPEIVKNMPAIDKAKSPWIVYGRPAINPYSEEIKTVFGKNASAMEEILRWGTPGPGTEYGNEYGGENLSFDPSAVNYNENNRGEITSEDRGLFMINSGTFDEFMDKMPGKLKELDIKSFDDMFNPTKNIKMAQLIYDTRGSSAWYGRPPWQKSA